MIDSFLGWLDKITKQTIAWLLAKLYDILSMWVTMREAKRDYFQIIFPKHGILSVTKEPACHYIVSPYHASYHSLEDHRRL